MAATHQPLEDRVREGKFREDLFHRLNVIRLRLPPLRERREDLPELTKHFLALSARGLGVPVKRISEGAMQVLAQFDFPGNVRQLENFCHWLTVMAPGQSVGVVDLPPEVRAAQLPSSTNPVTVGAGVQQQDGALRGGPHILQQALRGEPGRQAGGQAAQGNRLVHTASSMLHVLATAPDQ